MCAAGALCWKSSSAHSLEILIVCRYLAEKEVATHNLASA
jgi:hypothetical protein